MSSFKTSKLLKQHPSAVIGSNNQSDIFLSTCIPYMSYGNALNIRASRLNKNDSLIAPIYIYREDSKNEDKAIDPR